MKTWPGLGKRFQRPAWKKLNTSPPSTGIHSQRVQATTPHVHKKAEYPLGIAFEDTNPFRNCCSWNGLSHARMDVVAAKAADVIEVESAVR